MGEIKANEVKEAKLDDQEWTGIESIQGADNIPEDNDSQVLTIGDVLDTLNEDAFREYVKLSRCVAAGKSVEKVMHHWRRFKVNELQLAAIRVGLLGIEEAREELKRRKNVL